VIRTSQTHPLEIAPVEVAPGMGKIGVTLAPGKHDLNSAGGPWARDLATDLDAIVAWPASVLVTLIERHEFNLLGISKLGEEARRCGLEWLHLPIPDVSTPGRYFEAAWPAHSAALRGRLAAGDNIVVHCRGGLGRAGMISARLLVESGVDPDEAMVKVRKVRPHAIETRAQEQWVKTGPRS
jgi:ADP-ribosyl-[dinitrogen reductase] hydrolase